MPPRVAKKAPAKAPAKKAAPRKRAPRKAPPPAPPVLEIFTPPEIPEAPPLEVEVFDPAYQAYVMAHKGESWVDIATSLGYAGPAVAQTAVTRYLSRAAAEMSVEMKTAALNMQLDRYQAMLKAWWAAGTVGLDPQAGAQLLKICAQIDKLMRLDQPDAGGQSARTIVIQGATPAEYAAAARMALEERERA